MIDQGAPEEVRSRSRGRWRPAKLAAAAALTSLVLAGCGGGGAGANATTTTSGRITTEASGGPPPTTPYDNPAFVAGRVTAIGDSVMRDYEDVLRADLPGAKVQASVGEQWLTGIADAERLKRSHQLGAIVVIGLGTNGPVPVAEFRQMMSLLAGAERVVLVTVRVDQPWQASVNAVLRHGAAAYPNVVLADWATLAAHHPGWFYSDGTHLPIDGPGAHALAGLIRSAVRSSA